jgi:hypothetical protein
MERIRETFNDGVLTLLKQTTKRNTARVKIGVEDTTIAKLHYRRMALRDADVNAMGDGIAAKVTTKVKTVLHPAIKTEQKNRLFVKLDGARYNVLYSDYDTNYCYLYLERIDADDKQGTTVEAESTASEQVSDV